MLNNTEKKQWLIELNEVLELSRRESRHDIESIVLEEISEIKIDIGSIGEIDNIQDLNTSYMLSTPNSVLISNQLNNLIQYFGRKQVKAMVDLILNNDSKIDFRKG